jgi:GH24 family phage-related lysozyme (muramidase)
MALDYTPEGKNRLEIEKLQAELIDLRSWIRRWLSAAGGLVGIVTAAISIVVASNQIKSSSQQAETKLQQADARLAQAERLEKQRLALEATATLQEITTKTDTKSKELADKDADLAQKEARLKDITEKLTRAEGAARALSIAAKPLQFSAKALDLIVEFEGIQQPSDWYNYPGGITIGLGYELGLSRKEDFESDWKPHLPPEKIARLAEAIGLTGTRAADLAPNYRDIKISREAAVEVFERVTLPRYQAQAAKLFPGYEKLPLDAKGALVSLIYNVGPSKVETTDTRAKVAAGDLKGLGTEIRKMGGIKKVAARRAAEALLIESATKD